MKIVVCIKQVPDSDKVTIDRATNRLNRAGVPAVMNPFDENALEVALRLKDAVPGSTVTVVSMGPPQAEAVVREAIARGATDGVLVSGREFGGADTWATGYTLALAIRKLGPADLVLFGKQATDGDTAQVGPGIAHHLGLPVLTYAKAVEALPGGKALKVVRATEDGHEEWEVDLPCALTVVKEAGELRIGSLKSKMAKDALGDVMDKVLDIKGVKLLASKMEGVDMNGLRELGDQLKEKLGDGVVVLASVVDGKVNLMATATDAAIKAGAHAGNLIKGIAALVGGGGGGRPNMAQAGGKNPAGIDAALAKAAEVLSDQVK